jgi:hypothetical protein
MGRAGARQSKSVSAKNAEDRLKAPGYGRNRGPFAFGGRGAGQVVNSGDSGRICTVAPVACGPKKGCAFEGKQAGWVRKL